MSFTRPDAMRRGLPQFRSPLASSNCAEVAGERQLGLVIEALIVEYQHAELVHALFDDRASSASVSG